MCQERADFFVCLPKILISWEFGPHLLKNLFIFDIFIIPICLPSEISLHSHRKGLLSACALFLRLLSAYRGILHRKAMDRDIQNVR